MGDAGRFGGVPGRAGLLSQNDRCALSLYGGQPRRSIITREEKE